jgi:RNA polymerase sigma-70 factor (ECF subfamily)
VSLAGGEWSRGAPVDGRQAAQGRSAVASEAARERPVEPARDPRGGAPRRFSTTRWSLVIRAAESDGQQALSELCRAYWHPVHVFIQGHGLSSHDAADVTQELFERLLARNDIAKVDRARGQFRSWLRTCARNHMYNWLARKRRVSAGGRAVHVSTDVQLEALPDELTPDRLFDRHFAMTLLDRALARLRQRYERANKGVLFAHLQGGISGAAAELCDAELALRVGKSVGALKVERHRLKQRFQECLREEVAETVAGPGEIDDELRRLIDALA